MKIIGKTFVFSMLTLVCLILLGYGIAYLSASQNIGKNNQIEMYDNTGELFYQSNHEAMGKYIDLDHVSPYFVESIIAIEDRHFYNHHGFDLIGIFRALVNNLTKDTLQGASTITQQYARNLYLTNEVSLKRKLEEAMYTMQLETHLSKEEILEGYINTIYFGNGIYGIENAAHYYFNKSSQDLNLSESSLLAGIINGPTLYDPISHPDKAKERQQLVLEALYQMKIIDQNTLTTCLNEKIQLEINSSSAYSSSLQYYKDTVLNELRSLGYKRIDQIQSSLKIYTTLDSSLQSTLNTSTNNHMPDSSLECANIAIEPNTFKILAINGGKDYQLSQYNRAMDASRQVASTIKPLLYYLALRQGFEPTTTFTSEATTFTLANGKTYSPTNYADLYANKPITMIEAIALSDNIYAMKTHLFLGENALASKLEDFGLKNVSPDASLALGTLSTSIYTMTKIYTCFASLGKYQEPYCIEKIENQNGDELYQHQDKLKQLLDETSCLILTQMLQASFDEKCIDYSEPTLLNYKREQPFAAKSGTSDFDSLVIGYNQHIVVGSWVGYDQDQFLETYQDRIVAKKIWYDLTNLYLDSSWYQPNDQIEERIIDPLTGNSTPTGSLYWFKSKNTKQLPLQNLSVRFP